MYRTDDPNAVASAPTPSALGTEGYFSEGDPSGPTPATAVDAFWLNMVMGTLLAPIDLVGLAHSKTDDTQLQQAILAIIQAGLAEYADDVGIADAYVVNPSQAIAAYAKGQRVRFKAAHASTGAPATINVSGVGDANLVRTDGTGLHQGDIALGGLYAAECDGTNWQLISPAAFVSLNGSAAMTGALTLPGDPTLANHAANKHYVDSVAAGLHVVPCAPKAASTGPLTLSGPQIVDGVALIAGDLVLVKDQASQADNGVYVVAAGAWSRATEMDTWLEAVGGVVWVTGGTVNAQTSWVSLAAAGGTLGTDPIPFTLFAPTGHFQPLNALLTALSGLSPAAAGNMLYTTGSNVWALAAITAFGRSLVAAASASAARTALGLGSAAVASTGGSGHVVPFLDVGALWTNDTAYAGIYSPTSQYSIGYRGRPGYRQDSNVNIGGIHAGITLKHGDLTSPVVYTILDDAAGGALAGQVTYGRNGPGAGTALINVVPASDVTLRWNNVTGARTIAPNGYFELVKDVDNANEWMIRGEGIS